MAFAVTNWNIAENNAWYVKLTDTESYVRVRLFLTASDAASDTNIQAAGLVSLGSNVPVVLTNVVAGAVHLFQPEISWHLKVTGADGDATKTFKVGPFTDLPEIQDPIYNNSSLIVSRGTAEIDAHTHAITSRVLTLGSHEPSLDVGDVVRLDSVRRGKTVRSQVLKHTISASLSAGGECSMISEISVAEYTALRRA